MRYKDLSPFWKEVFFQNNYKGKDREKIEPILEKANPAITIETRIKSINTKKKIEEMMNGEAGI